MDNLFNPGLNRREFVAFSMSMLGVASLAMLPDISQGSILEPQSMTVQDVMNLVIRNVPNAPFAQTVDTLKTGKPDQTVTGIVTTMFATAAVIQQAIASRANFIIAHEPTFYNHQDDITAFERDPVYQFKRDLLDRHSIAVWRCHDYIHSLKPDGVLTGVLSALGWKKFQDTANPNVVIVPAQPLKTIVAHLKEKMGVSHVKVCGSMTQSCSRIGILPGAPGGRRQIQFLMEQHPDLLVCGEISEWETVEYIRDARASGESRSLVLLGHAVSEEPGMKWLADWLVPQVHSLKVSHVASGDPFTWS